MVLSLLNGPDIGNIDKVPDDLETFLRQYVKSEVSFEFVKQDKISVKSCQGLVYVGQREVAVIDPSSMTKNHSLTYLGSEDATTCHIIILKNSKSGKTALAHLDQVCSSSIEKVARNLSSADETPVEIHIFGGYEDERELSQELSVDLLRFLIKSKIK